MFVFCREWFGSPEKLFLIILSQHFLFNVENEDADSYSSLLGGGTSRGKCNGCI